jgi:phosphatidylserine/phosphatidylglycerophosphate/cardiolipin synthase-like enzyme
LRHIARYFFLGVIATVLMSFIRHGFLNHFLDSGPSLSSLHLPRLNSSISAATVPTTGGIHYSPTDNNEALDVQALRAVHAPLDIAMYAFTDHVLADAVADVANRGFKVRIYRDEQQYQSEQGRDNYVPHTLSNPNIAIRVKHSRDLMHLKEWSDGTRLREGSSNWSPSGEKRQDNSVVFLDKQAAQSFEQKFQEMWERPDNLVVQ